jgi:hypothetical protein
MADLAVLALATYATLGFTEAQHNIFNILSIANNSGSLDQATDKKGSATIGNVDPNLSGNGLMQWMHTMMPPLPVYKKGPLEAVTPNHPGMSTPLIRNLAVPSVGY